MKSPVVFLVPILIPFAWAYGWLMRLRVWCYDMGVLPSYSCGAFVVSIGNLQVGGTGKTPISAFFANRWKDKVRLGIVSRGYGRSSSGVLRVDPNVENAAAKFGDEPTLLAAITKQPVQVGLSRVQAARDLVMSEGIRLVLMDDGLQHLKLRRSFDFLLFDVTAPKWHWRLIPWGRMREPWSALFRADAVILTKTESVSAEHLMETQKLIRGKLDSLGRRQVPIIRMKQQIAFDFSQDASSDKAAFLVAGIARPEIFFGMVRRLSSDVRVVGEKDFVDHHNYSKEDVGEIVALARAAKATSVATTEKDAVKLLPLWRNYQQTLPLVVSELSVHPVDATDEKELERIDAGIFDQLRGLSGRAAR
ncbi:MAG: tetraacyldisaccharide 4'-kinase [Deltaproteobacteria bacterium]|nr:tetraacyldisaccharide 4'-kinase [Deltaproteobacteria bacterium]